MLSYKEVFEKIYKGEFYEAEFADWLSEQTDAAYLTGKTAGDIELEPLKDWATKVVVWSDDADVDLIVGFEDAREDVCKLMGWE